MPRLVRLTALSLWLLAGQVHAATVFNSFGPGDSFVIDQGYTLGLLDPPVVQGDAFGVTESGWVSDIWVAVSKVLGDGGLTVWLQEDNDGLPGEVLETFTFDNGELSPWLSAYTPLHAQSIVKPFLTASSTYWLLASTDSATWLAWNFGNLEDIGTHYGSHSEPVLSNEYRSAFRIDVTPIPEPETYALMLAGLGLLFLLTRPGRLNSSR